MYRVFFLGGTEDKSVRKKVCGVGASAMLCLAAGRERPLAQPPNFCYAALQRNSIEDQTRSLLCRALLGASRINTPLLDKTTPLLYLKIHR
jgi:hypothetical protein